MDRGDLPGKEDRSPHLMVFSLIRRLERVFKDKSERYGDAWWDDDEYFRAAQNFVSIRGKYKRLETMYKSSAPTPASHLAETHMDAALYHIMGAVIALHGKPDEQYDDFERRLQA